LDKGGLISFLLEKADHAALKDRLLAPISPAPAVKEKKEKRLSKMAIWASILGCGVGVIGLVVGIILSSSSDKQLNDVKTKLDRYDPITHDKVLKEKDELLTEKEKKIKELEKAVAELCVGAPQERKEALAELKNGNMEKARALLKKAIDAQCGVLAGDYYQMGNAYFVDKKPDYRAALAAYLEAERLEPGNAEYLNMVGVAYNALGEYGRALDYHERAMAIRKKVYGEQHPDVATSLNNLGSAYDALGDNSKAISYYEQSLTIDEAVFGKEHPDVAIDLNNLGSTYFEMGQKDKTGPYLQKAYAIFKQFYGDDHPHTKIAKEGLEKCR
jgi:tetratricopeptide (TPR) repeat protein